jgi:AcrR family transcriptional regulator
MVRSAAQLMRRKGVAGTGMREIVLDADAPRGSLQHYFPGGKDELVGEALRWIGGVASRRVRRHVERVDPRTPSALLAAMVEDWRVDLVREDFTAGCPLLAAAADSSASNDHIRAILREAFDGWQDPMTAALTDLGVPAERAPALAMVVISAVEGAIILARIRGDLAPLDAVVDELGPALDASVGRR